MSEQEQERKQPRITVEGTPYLLPTLESFDMDEAMILYRYSDLTFDQIWELEGVHPGVVAGLLHVAIARSDSSLRDREVREMVRNVNMMSVMEQLAVIADETPDPTKGGAPPTEDESKRSSDESTGSSGTDGSEHSEHFPEPSSPDSTGGPTSDTSADSDLTTSVA